MVKIQDDFFKTFYTLYVQLNGMRIMFTVRYGMNLV